MMERLLKKKLSITLRKICLWKLYGCGSFIDPDVMVKGFLKDDIIFMCSDGLTNMISEKEIYNIIMKDIEKATDVLIEKANNLGGYDNISVIILENR